MQFTLQSISEENSASAVVDLDGTVIDPGAQPFFPVDETELPFLDTGEQCESVLFQREPGFPPLKLFILFTFGVLVPGGSNFLIVPGNWVGVRGRRGEWVSPGAHPIR